MTIQVEAWRRSRDGEEQVKVTDASFVFVALDQGGRPRVINPGALRRRSIERIPASLEAPPDHTLRRKARIKKSARALF